MDASPRRYRAGESLEDYCAACHTDRMHTVIAADPDGRPIRVDCDYCHSQHNYRGGPRVGAQRASAHGGAPVAHRDAPRARQDRDPLPIVSERERSAPPMANVHVPGAANSDDLDLELLLRRLIREEAGVSAVVPADKWRGGTLALRPATEGLQEKSWPIETFFHKIVMLRNRLRTLEQVVNASAMSDEEKVKVQAYITGCYGSLTSFNVLFAEDEDQFKGSGGD